MFPRGHCRGVCRLLLAPDLRLTGQRVSSCSQVLRKNVHRLGLLELPLAQRCPLLFSANKSSEWISIGVKDPER